MSRTPDVQTRASWVAVAASIQPVHHCTAQPMANTALFSLSTTPGNHLRCQHYPISQSRGGKLGIAETQAQALYDTPPSQSPPSLLFL